MRLSLILETSLTRRYLFLLFSAVLATHTYAPSSHADQDEALKFPPQLIENAIQIRVTPRGQQYFETRLEEVLFRNGLSVSEGGFPGFKYEAATPITLNNLTPNVQPYRNEMEGFGQILREWLAGFDLDDPRPSLNIENIFYAAQFKKFGLRVSPKLTRDTGVDNGIVLILEAEASNLRIDVEKIRAIDAANPFLGVFGMDGVWIETAAPAGEPLKVQVAFSVTARRDDGIELNVLDFFTNINAIAFKTGFATPIILPKIEIRINDHPLILNPKKIENEFLKRQDKLVTVLQHYLKDALETKIPTFINETLAGRFQEKLRDLNEMNPPGKKNPTQGDKFKWGLQLDGLTIADEDLHVGLTSFIEDPKANGPIFLPDAPHAIGEPQLNAHARSEYDAALVLNESWVNRMLQLSFFRGYFNSVPITKDKTVRVVEAPKVTIDGNAPLARARVHAKIQYRPSGWEIIFLKSNVFVEIDLDVELRGNSADGFRLAIARVDESSFKLDPAGIRFGVFESTVLKKARKALRKANKTLEREEKVLMEQMPIPPSLAGIPIRVADARGEDGGYLVFYLEYGE